MTDPSTAAYIGSFVAFFAVCFLVAYYCGYAALAAAMLVTFMLAIVAYMMRDNLAEHFGDAPRGGWLYDHVDGIYCITLTRRPERVANAKEFFESINTKPTYVRAVDKKFDLDVLHLLGDCSPDGTCKLMPKFALSHGEVACYMSHLKALRTFLDDKRPDGKPCQTCIVCEDDVRPVEQAALPTFMAKMAAVVKEVKGVTWNVVNLGPCLSYCAARKPIAGASDVYDGASSSSKCSHFIMVNRAGAEAILENAFPIYNIPYDVKLNVLARQRVITMLETDEPLITQNRGRVKSELDHDDRLLHCVDVAPPRRKWLVFTSAGNQTRWYDPDMWGGADREYDVFVAFYGSDADRRAMSKLHADRFAVMTGGKFQNLFAWYHAKPEFFEGYQYVAVLDDDIEISTPDLNRMFRIASDRDLWVCQPSFSDDSKISFPITRHEDGVALAYTNFVEMNCPFFRADKLFEFLNSPRNDGTLYGYGTDYLYMDVLSGGGAGGSHDGRKFAVVHSVTCKNPRDDEKVDGREILKLASQDMRRLQWEQYAARRDLPDHVDAAVSCAVVVAPGATGPHGVPTCPT